MLVDPALASRLACFSSAGSRSTVGLSTRRSVAPPSVLRQQMLAKQRCVNPPPLLKIGLQRPRTLTELMRTRTASGCSQGDHRYQRTAGSGDLSLIRSLLEIQVNATIRA